MQDMITPAPETIAPASPQHALASLLCDLPPSQGSWSDDACLWLTDHIPRPIEFTDGPLQELPVSASTHQAMLLFLYRLFHDHLEPRYGVVMVSAFTLPA